MNFHEMSVEEVARLVEFFGSEALIKMAGKLPEFGAKYGDRTLGHFELFLNQLSSEDQDAVIRGEKRLTTEEVVRLIFDYIGRVIAPHISDVNSDVRDEKHDFHVELPELGYEEIRDGRMVSFFPKGTEFAEAARFEDEAEALKAKWIADPLIANFFKRARPVVFPEHDARKNYGASMQDFILPAVERAYKKSFPERKFTNYRDGELAGKISMIPGTGHDELVNLMAEKSVVAWYSPNPFQGFSIFAQREAMKTLTKYGLALAGGIDTGTAAIAYIEAIARDYQTPVYTCSALSWQSAGFSLNFSAYDDEFSFDNTGILSAARGCDSGGLVLFR